MQSSDSSHLYRHMIHKIIFLFLLLNSIISAVLYYAHISNQKDNLFHEISEKSRSMGKSICGVIENAINLGIPIESLTGVGHYLDTKVKGAQEISYIAITDSKGNLLDRTKGMGDNLKGSFKRMALSLNPQKPDLEPFRIYSYYNIPILIKQNNNIHGIMHVGLSNDAIKSNINDIFYDIAIILLAALVIGYEFISYIFTNSVTYPLRDLLSSLKKQAEGNFSEIIDVKPSGKINQALQKCNAFIKSTTKHYQTIITAFKAIPAQKPNYELLRNLIRELEALYIWPLDKIKASPTKPIVNNIRLVAFLLILAEAILVPQLASYAGQFYDDSLWVSKEWVSSSPIMIFMVFVTLTIGVSPKLTRRFGFRPVIVAGIFGCMLGYLTLFIKESLFYLLLSRAITGMCFSLCYVAFQNYMSLYAPKDLKISAYVIFLIAIGSAYICGSPIGGILVDNIGYKYAFLTSALIASLAALFSQRYIYDVQDIREDTSTPIRKSGVLSLLREPALTNAVILSGFPVRLLHSALICFIYPLYLQSLGNSQSLVGRIMMIFGVAMFIVAPLSPRIITKIKSPHAIAAFSTLVIGFTLLMDQYTENTVGVALGITIYTIFSTIDIAAMMAILENEAEKLKDKYEKNTILSFYFFFERIGMIVGSALASLLLHYLGFSDALFCIGICVILLGGMYALSIIYHKKARTPSCLPEKASSLQLNQLAKAAKPTTLFTRFCETIYSLVRRNP